MESLAFNVLAFIGAFVIELAYIIISKVFIITILNSPLNKLIRTS